MLWFRRCAPQVQLTIIYSTGRRGRRRPRVVPSGAQRIVVPTDLMFAAFRQLFPAERMVIFGGRTSHEITRVTSVWDVTEASPSAAHVRAATEKLTTALLDFDRASAHWALWMHSHPGEGARATHPSSTDLAQDRDIRAHHSSNLVGIIAVRDGWLRLFGSALEGGHVQIVWRGRGIVSSPENPHVFRLTLS